MLSCSNCSPQHLNNITNTHARRASRGTRRASRGARRARYANKKDKLKGILRSTAGKIRTVV